jgi:hypothetical protein
MQDFPDIGLKPEMTLFRSLEIFNLSSNSLGDLPKDFSKSVSLPCYNH